MADTTFVDYITAVPAAWFQDVNDWVYRNFFNEVSPRYYMTSAQRADVDALTYSLDHTAAMQSAFDSGKKIRLCNGLRFSTVNITTRGQEARGEGMGKTDIQIIAGGKGFNIQARNVTISDFRMLPPSYVNGTQSTTVADCITIQEASADANYVEGVKIERVMCESIKGCAIRMISPLRESHIRECRFKAMGNTSTGDGVIHSKQPSNSDRSPNYLWIENNLFYQFETPAINFDIDTSSASVAGRSNLPFFGIWIRNNVFHGQLLTEPSTPPYVRAGTTNQVYIKGCENLKCDGNEFTASHPNYYGLRVDSLSSPVFQINTNISVTNNHFSYNDLSIATPSGGYVRVTDSINLVVGNNQCAAGYFNTGTGYDFDARSSGIFASELMSQFLNNSSYNQYVVSYNYPATGSSTTVISPEAFQLITNTPLIQMRQKAASTARGDIKVDGAGTMQFFADPVAGSSGSKFEFYVDGTGASQRAMTIDTFLQISDLRYLVMTAVAAGTAGNNTIFRNSADNKLYYKDNGGTSNALY
jgi:hypothetical protein